MKKRYLLSIFFCFLVITLIYLAQTPNETLVWSRSVESDFSPNRLDRNIRSITRWPQWFHSLESVELLNPHSDASQEIFTGAKLILNINAKKAFKKPFQIFVEVIEYQPEVLLKIKVLSDSSEKLTRMFDSIIWTVDLAPIHLKNNTQGSSLKGTVHAHTCHWRSRLFGKISKKILMFQIFYPDLLKLSFLKHPYSIELRVKPAGASD